MVFNTINIHMGVRGLQSFVKQYAHIRTMKDLLSSKAQPLRIGIDISFYMYRWQADVERIVKFIRQLEGNNHHVLLAFDGRAEDGKQWEAQRRRDTREKETNSANELMAILKDETLDDDQRFFLEQKAAEHQRKGWALTKDLRNLVKERLFKERVPMVKAKGEADGFLAAAAYSGDLDIVISGDMDLLAMGCTRLWTPLEDGLSFREFQRERILQELRLDNWQFRSMCALCYTEASEEINTFNIQQAYQYMRVFRSLTVLRNKYPDMLSVWPEENHIFYRSVDKAEPWLREDQLEIYRAFLKSEPMPYA